MKKESSCLYCNAIFTYETSSSKGKFCNNKCQANYRFENKTIKKIKENKCRDAGTLKRFLAKTVGYRCIICNLLEWNNKDISLHLDHIDGNADNNTPENIRLLCPNCHSQTETFCGRNKKNSKRSTYNQRYRLQKLSH
jgi:hypothetical protein